MYACNAIMFYRLYFIGQSKSVTAVAVGSGKRTPVNIAREMYSSKINSKKCRL